MFHNTIGYNTITNIKEADTADLMVLYRRFHMFCLTCKRNNLIPNFINFNIKSNSSSRNSHLAVETAKRNWLLREIRKWYQVRNNLRLHLKVTHTELFNSVCNFLII